jgi:hypothetical protein
LFKALKIYKSENEDKDFAFMQCIKKLEGCKKWNGVLLSLNDGKIGGDGEGLLRSLVALVDAIGNNKAKAEMRHHHRLK